MSRPDPIEYAERLYGAIRDANFSPISFLAFGNAVKDSVPFRQMPRVAAEPFMRIVGEMLEMEEESAEDELPEAELIEGVAEAPEVVNAEEPTTPAAHGVARAPAEARTPSEADTNIVPPRGGAKRGRR
jgi:hypothetical protein